MCLPTPPSWFSPIVSLNTLIATVVLGFCSEFVLSGVQITSCLGNVITNFLWRQMQGLLLGARVDVTPTAPSCTSGVRL